MNAHNIDVVLDVGANDGAYGREIRDRGYKGFIVSLEPNIFAYDRLSRSTRRDPLWSVHPIALGEIEGESKLFIGRNDAMSSIKNLTEYGLSTGAKPVDTQRIKVMRLDQFLALNSLPGRNIYLKIDTQGYEAEVIRGAGKILQKIKVIQAEVALVHTYADELDWLAFIRWMRDNQFEVATAVCNSTIGAQVREFDFVFVRRQTI